jgi:hypothetical protein
MQKCPKSEYSMLPSHVLVNAMLEKQKHEIRSIEKADKLARLREEHRIKKLLQ